MERAERGDAAGDGGNTVMSALAVLLGSSALPRSLRLPVGLAAATPLLRHAAADYAARGVTSHVLEAMAVSISLARSDFVAANTTTFMLALGEYMEELIARRSDDLLKHLAPLVTASGCCATAGGANFSGRGRPGRFRRRRRRRRYSCRRDRPFRRGHGQRSGDDRGERFNREVARQYGPVRHDDG